MQTFGIIGMGNMGNAIYHYLQQEGFSIVTYDPFSTTIDGEKRLNSIEELAESCDGILLCVKPDQVETVLKEIKKPTKIFSIVAGFKLQNLKKLVAQNSILVRLMPNLPLMVGEGCVGYYGHEQGYSDVVRIFSRLGKVYALPSEKMLEIFTGIAGSGPAFVFSFLHAMAEGGVLAGTSYRDALQWSIQVLKGSAVLLEQELLQNPEAHPMQWRNKVTSPAGTTIEGMKELEKNNFHYAVMKAIDDTCDKARKMG